MGILRSNVKVRVPLSQLHYDENEFRFKWKKVWLPVPYGEKILKKKDARILEEFKDNLENDLTISFRWHRIRHLPEEMVILADTSIIERINEVTACARTLLSNMEERMASGTLTMKEARSIMVKSKLKSSDAIIYRIVADIVHRMPEQLIKVKLQVPLSQLTYDSRSFRFQWNEIWLAVPYEQPPLKIKDSRFLEIFKALLKSNLAVTISWNRFLQKIEAIDVEVSPSNTKELSDISSRMEKCVEDIRALVKERKLSLEKAKDILVAEGLGCSDDEVHQILTAIIDEMALQKEPVSVSVPLKGIEYGHSEFTFHHAGKLFRLDNDKIPFETGPILEKIKGQLEGDLIFHMDRDCLIKWDRENTKLLVGELSTRVEEMGEKVEIAQETLDSFEELRAKLICDAIEALDRKTISIEQVEPILKDWGLALDNQKIGQKIVDTIPQWEVRLSFKVRADEAEYSSEGITCTLEDGREEFIPSTELPFGTGDVLEGIKGILEGNINVIIHYTKGFIWNKENERLAIEQSKKSYTVTVDDEFLKSIKFLDVPFVSPLYIGTSVRPRGGSSGDPREEGYYHPGCSVFLKYLIEQAKGEIYITSVDLWLKIDDILIWERPQYSAATYFFHWPNKPLKDFIHYIWGETLEYLRDNESKTGYITRAMHDHDYGLASWKGNMKSKIFEHARIRIP